MDLGEWPQFLARWSAEWLDAADEEDLADLPPGTAENRWLGFAGATEERLLAAEQRLGCRLPPSYREFLAVTDGWRHAGPFVDRLSDTDSVGWFRDVEARWLAILDDGDPDRKVLMRSLCVSDGSTSQDAFLLDPAREWAAWTFTADGGLCQAGASFRELMEEQYAAFHWQDMPENATSEQLDRQCAKAREALLAGDLDAQLPVLDQAVDFGRIRALIMRAQVTALLGDTPSGPFYSTEAAWLLDDPTLGTYAILLPMLDAVVDSRIPPRGLGVLRPGQLPDLSPRPKPSITQAVNSLFGRSRTPPPAWAAAMAAAIDTATFAPRFQDETFDAAVTEARRLTTAGRDEQAWQAIAEALPSWKPSGPCDVAPTLLVADSALARLITAERGRTILTTPRGQAA